VPFRCHSWHPTVNSWTSGAYTTLKIVGTCDGHPMAVRTVFGMDSESRTFLRPLLVTLILFLCHPIQSPNPATYPMHPSSFIFTEIGLTWLRGSEQVDLLVYRNIRVRLAQHCSARTWTYKSSRTRLVQLVSTDVSSSHKR